MSKVTVIDHPLVQHKLALLRDKETGTKAFRELVSELAMLMGYEVTRDLPLQEVEVETPITKAAFKMLANEKLAVVPILRAGLGMADGMMNLIPHAKMGHIGLYRNPDTLMPTGYYCKLPDDICERDTIIVDPMLATGNWPASTKSSTNTATSCPVSATRAIVCSERNNGNGALCASFS